MGFTWIQAGGLAGWFAGSLGLLCLGGCFSYVHHDRGTPADFRLPIDEDKPLSAVEWSTVWGGTIPVWQPVRCLHEDGSVTYVVDGEKDRACKRYERVCEHGVGRTEVSLLGYSLPLAIVTLGFAMPAQITLYCSTASEPDGPMGPE